MRNTCALSITTHGKRANLGIAQRHDYASLALAHVILLLPQPCHAFESSIRAFWATPGVYAPACWADACNASGPWQWDFKSCTCSCSRAFRCPDRPALPTHTKAPTLASYQVSANSVLGIWRSVASKTARSVSCFLLLLSTLQCGSEHWKLVGWCFVLVPK